MLYWLIDNVDMSISTLSIDRKKEAVICNFEVYKY